MLQEVKTIIKDQIELQLENAIAGKQYTNLRDSHRKSINLLKDKILEIEHEICSKKNMYNDKEEIHLEKTKANEIIRSKSLHDFIYNKNLFNIEKRNIKILRKDIKTYRNDYNEKENIDFFKTLYSDDYADIKVLIITNDKPKKKYRLCIYGESLFLENNLLGNNRDYGCNFKDDYDKIVKIIKDAPTIDELTKYYDRNKDKIIQNIIINHKQLVKDYEIIKEKYEKSDFNILEKGLKVQDNEVKEIFLIKDGKTKIKYIMYEKYIYSQIKNKEINEDDPLEYIKYKNNQFRRLCSREQLRITKNSNVSFGNWYSIHIEKSEEGIILTKKNLEKYIKDAKKDIFQYLKNPKLSFF